MKFKATQREINNGYFYKISIGYCDLQTLLNYENPVAYTCGIYGWNADVYSCFPEIPWNVAIVTGYRPFGNIQSNYGRNKKYEAKARKIANDYSIPYETRKKRIHKLLVNLVNEYIQEERKEK